MRSKVEIKDKISSMSGELLLLQNECKLNLSKAEYREAGRAFSQVIILQPKIDILNWVLKDEK